MCKTEDYSYQSGESSRLIRNGKGNGYAKDSEKGESEHGLLCNRRRLMDIGIGFALCALLAGLVAIAFAVVDHSNTSNTSSNHTSGLRSNPNLIPPTTPTTPTSSTESQLESKSKYTRFQAMGFQIYTGGAPALVPVDVNSKQSQNKKMQPSCG